MLDSVARGRLSRVTYPEAHLHLGVGTEGIVCGRWGDTSPFRGPACAGFSVRHHCFCNPWSHEFVPFEAYLGKNLVEYDSRIITLPMITSLARLVIAKVWKARLSPYLARWNYLWKACLKTREYQCSLPQVSSPLSLQTAIESLGPDSWLPEDMSSTAGHLESRSWISSCHVCCSRRLSRHVLGLKPGLDTVVHLTAWKDTSSTSRTLMGWEGQLSIS